MRLSAGRRGLGRLPEVQPDQSVAGALGVGELATDLVHAIQKRL